MAQDKITSKQQEILEYIKETIYRRDIRRLCGRFARQYI